MASRRPHPPTPDDQTAERDRSTPQPGCDALHRVSSRLRSSAGAATAVRNLASVGSMAPCVKTYERETPVNGHETHQRRTTTRLVVGLAGCRRRGTSKPHGRSGSRPRAVGAAESDRGGGGRCGRPRWCRRSRASQTRCSSSVNSPHLDPDRATTLLFRPADARARPAGSADASSGGCTGVWYRYPATVRAWRAALRTRDPVPGAARGAAPRGLYDG